MVFTWVGAAALIILVLTTFANVVGRYLLRMPLTGAVEISQLFLVVTVFFGVAYTEVRKQHVTFDEVVVHFPATPQGRHDRHHVFSGRGICPCHELAGNAAGHLLHGPQPSG